MTETTAVDKFYGAALLLLRWRVKRWGRPKLATESGVSAASLLNYERGKTVPDPEIRKKLAGALGVSLAGLDRLAAAIQKGMIGLQGAEGVERIVAGVTAALADDFSRAAAPLVEQLLSSQESTPPASSDEEIRALAPILEGIDVPELQVLVEKTPSLRRWTFLKLVGEESARSASTDATRALQVASLGLWVAERVSGDEGWQCRVFAWAIMGNARRVASDLDGALEAFASSARLRAEGRRDLPEVWRLLDLEASLRIDLRQVPEALRLLDQAAQAAPPVGAIRAHLLCKRSNALERMGDSEGSIAALREAMAQVDLEAEPRLLCMLQFNLMESLCAIGQAAEAEPMLPEQRRLQSEVGNGLNQLRLRWLEGKIAAGLGRADEAITALSAVRSAFAKEDIRYDEALAGMELAGLYLEQGRAADVKSLVQEMEPVFRAKGVHEEAQKALKLFRRAVELETATVELVRRIVAYLYRAQNDPVLRFEEAG